MKPNKYTVKPGHNTPTPPRKPKPRTPRIGEYIYEQGSENFRTVFHPPEVPIYANDPVSGGVVVINNPYKLQPHMMQADWNHFLVWQAYIETDNMEIQHVFADAYSAEDYVASWVNREGFLERLRVTHVTPVLYKDCKKNHLVQAMSNIMWTLTPVSGIPDTWLDDFPLGKPLHRLFDTAYKAEHEVRGMAIPGEVWDVRPVIVGEDK